MNLSEEELPKALQKHAEEENVKNNFTDNKKKKSKKVWLRILITIIILGILGISTLAFLLYGPYSGFREWLITSAMTTMRHQYLATWFYSDETIQEVLNNNKVHETDESTDTSMIVVVDDKKEEIQYANEYERQILEKDPEHEDYKIIKIEGKGYDGYMAVIYDPSRIKTVYTSKLGTTGEYLTKMAQDNDDMDKLEIVDLKAEDDPSDIIANQEYSKTIERKIKENLSEYELSVLYEYEKGHSYADIAEKLKTKVKSVDTAIQRIKKKANKIKESIEF